MDRLFELIEKGGSPFHVVETARQRLEAEGFVPLAMDGEWALSAGGSYYVIQQGACLIAFTVGSGFTPAQGMRIAAAHVDFPCLSVKPRPEMPESGYLRLNVEPYGGLILNTWLDRPLSIAGRVALKGERPLCPRMELVDFQRPMLTIPNLAIHLNKEINKGVELDRQKDMLPILALTGEETGFEAMVARELGVEIEDILGYELNLYNMDAPCRLGRDGEMVSAPRLDNLTGVAAVLQGLLEGRRAQGVNVGALFHHEEIGSRSSRGAGSSLLSGVLERVYAAFGGTRAQFLQAQEDSMLLSIDVAHALHPNKVDKYDPTNRGVLGGGVCIKQAVSQSYATDCQFIGALRHLCERENIPCQMLANRSDGGGGGTLGSIASAVLPVRCADVGVGLLAMHSARELMGTADQQAMERLTAAFLREP